MKSVNLLHKWGFVDSLLQTTVSRPVLQPYVNFVGKTFALFSFSFHLISSIARQVSKMKTVLFLTIAFSNILLGKGFDLCSTDSDCPIYAGLNSTCHVECGLCGNYIVTACLFDFK